MMKTKFLIAAAVLVGFGLQAQTNALPSSANAESAAPARKTAPASTPSHAGGTTAPSSSPSTTPVTTSTPRAPVNTEARNASESSKVRSLVEALSAQKPNSKELEQHRTTGLFPAFFRTVKSGSNPLQLINPFAPVGAEEKGYSAVRSRVFDDPKTHASPGVDIFSVSY